MRLARILTTSLILCLAVGGAVGGQLSPGLQAQLDGLRDDAVVRVLVVLEDQADVPGLDRQLRAQVADLARRHRTIVGALQTTAARSQGPLLGDLRRGREQGEILGFTPHWLVNSVVVTATVDEVRRLAGRQDVASIEPDLVAQLIQPSRVSIVLPAEGVGITPGVATIGARRVWDELGIDGTGVIVGNLDTGVDFMHPALSARWRGNFAPAVECWLDAAAWGDTIPVDWHYHGTHTMGTICGQAPGDSIGVAPGALWIASNILNYSGPYDEGFDNGVIASLEFMTDPDGDPMTSSEVPAVVMNSWGVHEDIADYFDCDSRWWDALDNCEAAGVALVWVAGNEGPAAGTVRSPGDRATTATSGFCVGSTIHAPPYTISETSSLGPSACGGEFAGKPEIVAPGVDVYSAVPDSGYDYLSGTSMAGPHVAGVMALMRAANPDVDVVTIKEILMTTAADLGPVGEDNTYGHGFIDAYAAVLAVLSGWGTVQGTVTDGNSGLPLAGVTIATVATIDGAKSTSTDQAGVYRMTVPSGLLELVVEYFGYFDHNTTLTVPENGTTTADFQLYAQPTATVSGQILSSMGEKVIGASVMAMNAPLAAVLTDTLGRYELDLPAGLEAYYDLLAADLSQGYAVHAVNLATNLEIDLQLAHYAGEDFESGGLTSYPWVLDGDALWAVTTGEVFEGAFSAQSGILDHTQTSVLSLVLEVPHDSFLAFKVKVSSEAGGDFLILEIDDLEQARWSGVLPWTAYSQLVRAGSHTLRWTYQKNESGSAGSDCAWLDLIELPLPIVTPQPDITVDLEDITVALLPDGAVMVPLTTGNEGELDLDFTIKLDDLTEPGKAVAVDPALAPGWVRVQPKAGNIEPGGILSIDVIFDAAGLELGIYTAELEISSNDPDTPSVILPVTLTVNTPTPAGQDLPDYTLALIGAIPNPFNPTAEIQFVLPASTSVELDVYDVSGRLVRSLMAGRLGPGPHAVTWDGRDKAGRNVASGTYFALLRAGQDRLVRSMVLVR